MSTTLKEEDMEDDPFPDIKTAGNVEIKIGANYKMRYVSGTWESMYRRNALSRARQVRDLDMSCQCCCFLDFCSLHYKLFPSLFILINQ